MIQIIKIVSLDFSLMLSMSVFLFYFAGDFFFLQFFCSTFNFGNHILNFQDFFLIS